MDRTEKPLGRKAYGHIGHLPGSRIGPGDHMVDEGHARICLEALNPQRRFDTITVTEKLDGSCCAVALLDGVIVPLGRSGYPAVSSSYEQHHLFAQWAWANEDRFRAALREGERIVGEWLAQAHGTRYDLEGHSPFAAFDLMRGEERETREEFQNRLGCLFDRPTLLHEGGPLPLEDALALLGEHGFHGADEAEGVVYRVESTRNGARNGARYVDILAKYVRPDKCDGCLLPDISGGEAVWNWRPQ